MTVTSVKDMIVQTETTLNLAEMERVEKERERLEAVENTKWTILLGALESLATALRTTCQLEPHSYTVTFDNVVASTQYANGHTIVFHVHADDAVVLTCEAVTFEWGKRHTSQGKPGVTLIDTNGMKVSSLADFLRALQRVTGEAS